MLRRPLVIARASFNPTKVLKRNLDFGDSVEGKLEEDDIHEEPYRPGLFLGVGFNFSTNPFPQENTVRTNGGGDG